MGGATKLQHGSTFTPLAVDPIGSTGSGRIARNGHMRCDHQQGMAAMIAHCKFSRDREQRMLAIHTTGGAASSQHRFTLSQTRKGVGPVEGLTRIVSAA